MIGTQEKVIGQNKYSVMQLGGHKSLEVAARLGNMLGDTSGEILSSEADWGRAVGKFLKSLSPENLRYLADAMASHTDVTTPDGKSPRLSDVFDAHFRGRTLEMFQWLIFALEVNFADFLDGIKGFLGNLAAGSKIQEVQKTTE